LKGALNGVEEVIRALAMKKPTDAQMNKASKELVLLGYQMAVLGELTAEYPPPKKRKGKGTPKQWQELSETMRSASLELVAAAQKKDAEAVHKASDRLNASCSQCHSDFR
jgi:cytochrome c556